MQLRGDQVYPQLFALTLLLEHPSSLNDANMYQLVIDFKNAFY